MVVGLPRILRRCRCFYMVLGPGIMQRVPLQECPKHGNDHEAWPSLKDLFRHEASR